MARQWTKKEEDKLLKLCFEEKTNAEMAKIFNCRLEDIHRARTRLNITIAKVAATKAELAGGNAAKKTTASKNATPAKKDNPAEPIAKAFDVIDIVLLTAAKKDEANSANYRLAAAGVSSIKTLLLGSLR